MELGRRALFQVISWGRAAQAAYAVVLVAMGCLLFTSTVQSFAEVGSSLHSFCDIINSFACHQLDDRLLYFGTYSTGVCARCYSFYLFILVGVVLFSNTPISFQQFNVMNIPLVVDGVCQLLGIWDSSSVSRLISGGLSGMAVALVSNRWRSL